MASSIFEMPAKGKPRLHSLPGWIENGIATPLFIKQLGCSYAKINLPLRAANSLMANSIRGFGVIAEVKCLT
jgi:hypothetical protein